MTGKNLFILAATLLICSFCEVIAQKAPTVIFSGGSGLKNSSTPLDIEVRGEPLQRIIVQYSPDLENKWTDWGPPTIAFDRTTPLSLPIADLPEKGFFRVVVEPPRITARRTATEISLNVREEGAKASELLMALHLALGEAPAMAYLDYDPESEATIPPTEPIALKPGLYVASDLESLGKRIGLRLQSPPTAKDTVISTFTPNRGDQGNPIELPGDEATGRIEDGWKGDNITVVPEQVNNPPQPGTFDMKFNRDVPFRDKLDLRNEVSVETGIHLRLRLAYDGQRFRIENAQEQAGSGLTAAPFNIPTDGSYVLSVEDATGAFHHLWPFDDPRNERIYFPPGGGSHGFQLADTGTIRLTVPLRGENLREGLKGSRIRILQVINSGDLRSDGLLTPENIAQNPSAFKIVETLPEASIIAALDRPTPRPKAASKAPTITTLHRSGSNGTKFNIAVIGDGFADTVADQTAYNDFVADRIIDTLETRDIHPAILNGINLFRINTFSEASGITTVAQNSSANPGAIITSVSTALEYRYSADWNRCWMEPGPNTENLISNITDSLCPQADFVIVALNTTGQGGCARSSHFAVTLRPGNWGTIAHEFGHNPGGLGDEYTCNTACGCYTGGEPGAPNQTINTVRSSLKWNSWVPSWRPLPTAQAHVADTSQDVGRFPGVTIGQNQWTSCIFRPSFLGRMNNNTPLHNPVGYTNVREQFRPFQSADFRKNVVGDFDGDGRSDVLIQDGRQFALYLAGDRDVGADDPITNAPPRNVTGVLKPTWFQTDYMRNGGLFWRGREADILLPGDFNGDGKDDLYIINHSTWPDPYVAFMRSEGDGFKLTGGYQGDLPGWERRPGDQFQVLDFDGDGRDDLAVYNGVNWAVPYLGLLRSTGNGLVMTRRYDRFLPNWEMGRHETIHVGDFNGDSRDDLIVFNRNSWSQVHLQVYNSTGGGLRLADRYYGTIPGIWTMRRRDSLKVINFNGDNNDDISLFNGRDWGPTYLAYIGSDSGKLFGVRRYDNTGSSLPGWQMQRRDRHYVADVDGDGDEDLVVYNKDNWVTQYLGILRSDPVGATIFSARGSWQDDWINGWNLGSSDKFQVAEFRGGANWADLYVFNAGWFGMLRSHSNHFRQETIYRKWIYNHRYHGAGLW